MVTTFWDSLKGVLAVLLSLKFILVVLPVFIRVAFFTLLERKILRIVGFRLGPNKVRVLGILQPVGDAFKLFNKEINNLSNYGSFFHYLRALLSIIRAILLWNLASSEPSPLGLKSSILSLILILGVNRIGSILAGWRTFRKFSLIGSLRTVAQLISYEASLYMCFFFFIFIYASFGITRYHFSPILLLSFTLPFCFYIWVPSFLAELNRTPYDFSEGERELVRGFNTEFGSRGFTIFFLSEYSNIIFFCIVSSFIFFSISLLFFFLIRSFFVVWIRRVLPRYRYDKLMSLSWKFFIPFITVMVSAFFLFIG